jgi:cytochrome P450
MENQNMSPEDEISAKPKAPSFALRQAIALSKDPVGYLKKQQDKLGDPFCVKFPTVGDIYFTGHPEGAKETFTANRDVFEPPEFNPVAPILGDHSLILLTGERHRKERKMMMPHLAGERMREYEEVIHKLTLEEMSSWEQGKEFSAFDMTQSIILQVIFQGIFGVRDEGKREQFKTMVVDLLTSYTTSLAVLPFLRKELGGVGPWSKFLRSREAFDALLMEEIQARRESGLEHREDILSLLMSAQYDDGTMLSDLELIEEIRTLLVGGHDTSSNTLAWAFYFICSSADIKSRIREEISTLGPDFSASQLTKLPYLSAVCNEALRIYPPVPFVLRRVVKPFSLRGVSLDPGDNIAVAMVLLHRNPDVWDEPAVFNPDRFIDKKYSLYDFAPYGGGVRRCIGASFATYAMKIVIGTIFQNANLELARPVKLRAVVGSITMAPNKKIPLVYRGEYKRA